jgi:hypothetical protein
MLGRRGCHLLQIGECSLVLDMLEQGAVEHFVEDDAQRPAAGGITSQEEATVGG